MRRFVLLLVVLVAPAAVLAQGMVSFSGVVYCVCTYDCMDAGASQRIKATCTNLADGGVCYYPRADLCPNGVCNMALSFSFEGNCTTGPTVTGTGYATAQGCAHSACYYKTDGGTCSSAP